MKQTTKKIIAGVLMSAFIMGGVLIGTNKQKVQTAVKNTNITVLGDDPLP